jgi:PAS domain S-box-containing protein
MNENNENTCHLKENDYYVLVQNIEGLIGFRIDENSLILFISGAVENVTGYKKEEFLSGKVKWKELVFPEDWPLVFNNMKNAASKPDASFETEYRIRKKDGEIKWVREVLQKLPADSKTPGYAQGFVRDITERKAAEFVLKKVERIRIKEIHHRIKNNLQVISSFFSLEAERFKDEKVLEVFRESQNRVALMAQIHEKLYLEQEANTIDFTDYLKKLISGLFRLYRLENKEIELKFDLEQVFLRADISVPLGIIVNELVSNSLKYAFSGRKRGEIRISLYEEKSSEKKRNLGAFRNKDNYTDEGALHEKVLHEGALQYILVVADNGQGISEEVNFRNSNSVGLQLVNTLVEQIEGQLELKRENGTEFRIRFFQMR